MRLLKVKREHILFQQLLKHSKTRRYHIDYYVIVNIVINILLQVVKSLERGALIEVQFLTEEVLEVSRSSRSAQVISYLLFTNTIILLLSISLIVELQLSDHTKLLFKMMLSIWVVCYKYGQLISMMTQFNIG